MPSKPCKSPKRSTALHDPYEQSNPYREPSWRFERVIALATRRSNGLLPSLKAIDDAIIRQTRDFYLRWFRSPPENRDALFTHAPGLYYAFMIHERQQDLLTATIEARILAGQSNEEIANLIGTMPAAIDLYEKVFFNVRDRLDRKDWVVRQVFGPSLAHRFGSDYAELSGFTLKFFGYFGGPRVLDLVLYSWTEEMMPSTLADAQHAGVRQANGLIRRAALLAARRFEVNRHNVMRLFEVYTKILDYELKERKELGATKERGIEDNIRGMLSEIVFTVGDLDAEQHPAYAKLAEYQHCAAELRDDQVLRWMALGIEPPEEIKTLSIPPPATVVEPADEIESPLL